MDAAEVNQIESDVSELVLHHSCMQQHGSLSSLPNISHFMIAACMGIWSSTIRARPFEAFFLQSRLMLTSKYDHL